MPAPFARSFSVQSLDRDYSSPYNSLCKGLPWSVRQPSVFTHIFHYGVFVYSSDATPPWQHARGRQKAETGHRPASHSG